MALDLWSHQFCLACDKQVQTDGAAYCSESCRQADHETASSTASPHPSSPEFTPSDHSEPWPSTATASSSSAAYHSPLLTPLAGLRPLQDGQVLQLHEILGLNITPLSAPSIKPTSSPSNLTPSSSHSSLSSLKSSLTPSEDDHLSHQARQELKAYAISFEQVRLRRRRSQ